MTVPTLGGIARFVSSFPSRGAPSWLVRATPFSAEPFLGFFRAVTEPGAVFRPFREAIQRLAVLPLLGVAWAATVAGADWNRLQ